MKGSLSLGGRLLIGGIAGFVGTMAMTSAMRRLHQRLPEGERYPLTPREIVDSAASGLGAPLSSERAQDLTLAMHFGYGAACGAIMGAINPRMNSASGALAGTAVWLGSYMGWLPAAGILKPATVHPARRNMLMIGAHLIWGTATVRAMRELVAARETMLASGPDNDVPLERRSNRRA